MRVIIDASVTMAWCFLDETTPFSESVLDDVRDNGALVPAIWPLEIANTLLIGERRNRITAAESAAFYDLLKSLPVTVDEQALAHAWGSVTNLGRQFSMTAYDACYVELAVRSSLPVATSDNKLRDVAFRLGIPLSGEAVHAETGRTE